jgi:hypothetical protein
VHGVSGWRELAKAAVGQPLDAALEFEPPERGQQRCGAAEGRTGPAARQPGDQGIGIQRAPAERREQRVRVRVRVRRPLTGNRLGAARLLARLRGCDGYIAQVWTGTSRTPNVYRGVRRERTFETAFLEYGAMQNLVRATGRTVWYLNDPIEDNPDHDWTDYRTNWESTLVASRICATPTGLMHGSDSTTARPVRNPASSVRRLLVVVVSAAARLGATARANRAAS